MKITILCSSPDHPVNEMLFRWLKKNEKTHEVNLARHKHELQGGDLLFLISCSDIIRAAERNKYSKTLVIHASDLPRGRGWSPHIWEIVNGANRLTVTLLEAEDKVDSGDVWQKINIEIPKHALYDELNELLFEAEAQLMDFAVSNFTTITPQPQDVNKEPSYYPKRTPADSELDPDRSLTAQFDLIRVCDSKRFPAFFKIHGCTYALTIEKVSDEK